MVPTCLKLGVNIEMCPAQSRLQLLITRCRQSPPQGSFAQALNMRIFVAREQMNKYVPHDNYESLEITGIWANINRDGHYNYAHVHNAVWAGFYYVNDGDPDPSRPYNGYTSLVKDLKKLPWNMPFRPKNAEELVTEYLHPATAGAMLIFPGNQLHYVEAYYGTGARMTIAFNFGGSLPTK